MAAVSSGSQAGHVAAFVALLLGERVEAHMNAHALKKNSRLRRVHASVVHAWILVWSDAVSLGLCAEL
ncbi:hypothetical protein ACFXTH_000882 [Malus domestica]